MPVDHADPTRVPGTQEGPAERLARAQPVAGTPGEAYVERRGVPLAIAEAAGMRFDPDWHGRGAVLLGVYGQDGALTAVHGRYVSTLRGQDKMLTVGVGGGVCGVCGGGGTGRDWRADPLILVEGVFDALSLAVCGWSSIATIGRWAPWLPAFCAGRVVWLAFDANGPGDREAVRYAERLAQAKVRRRRPPPHCKDWNTALVKRGRGDVTRWLRDSLATGDKTGP